MSGKRRIVPVLVDDERVTDLSVKYLRWADGEFVFRGQAHVAVPSDDQLTRKIDGVTKLAASKVAEYEAVGLPVPDWLAERARDAADIRAALDLDTEGDE